MRNLINFIYRYHVGFLFLILQVIGFALLVSYNYYHTIRFMSWSGDFSGKIYLSVHELKSYLALREANQQLAEENAALQNMVYQNFSENKAVYMPFADTALTKQFTYTAAEVIHNTLSHKNNHLIINKGKKHGIEADMAVVSPLGVAGIIIDVSEHYSVAMSLLHKNMRLSCRIANNNYFGILQWDGSHPKFASLGDIPSHVVLSKGDTVVSRESGGIFPDGTPVGSVVDWSVNPSTGFLQIQVELFTDFGKLYHVHIIKNEFKTEFDELEVRMEVSP